MPQLLTLGRVQARYVARHVAHAPEIVRPLGHADGAACVQHVEQVGALQVVIVRRHRQPGLQAAPGLALVGVVHRLEGVHVGDLKVVVTVLDFAAQEDVFVGDGGAVIHLPDAVGTLQGQGDAVQAVGDFHRHGVERQAAGLLEIGELGDFLAVQPHLPAQAPGTQGGAFPIVLDKPHVVLAQIDAECLQAGQIALLGVAGVRLQDDLQLMVHLQAIRVVAEAAVVRPDTGFDVHHVPRFRAQHAQNGGGVHGAGADLHVIGLLDKASLVLPVLEQPQNDVLKAQGLCHCVPYVSDESLWYAPRLHRHAAILENTSIRARVAFCLPSARAEENRGEGDEEVGHERVRQALQRRYSHSTAPFSISSRQTLFGGLLNTVSASAGRTCQSPRSTSWSSCPGAQPA